MHNERDRTERFGSLERKGANTTLRLWSGLLQAMLTAMQNTKGKTGLLMAQVHSAGSARAMPEHRAAFLGRSTEQKAKAGSRHREQFWHGREGRRRKTVPTHAKGDRKSLPKWKLYKILTSHKSQGKD